MDRGSGFAVRMRLAGKRRFATPTTLQMTDAGASPTSLTKRKAVRELLADSTCITYVKDIA